MFICNVCFYVLSVGVWKMWLALTDDEDFSVATTADHLLPSIARSCTPDESRLGLAEICCDEPARRLAKLERDG